MIIVRHAIAAAALAFALPAMAQTDVPAEQSAPVTEEVVAEEAAVAKPTGPNYYDIETDMTVDPETVLLLDLSNGGRVAIRLKPEWAPNHVARIQSLAQQGFYDGVIFHRVIDGFMAQTGDPTGTGLGGSDLPDLAAEFNRVPHLRGTVSMARTDAPDTANSQFFIVFYPRMALDRSYTNFGRVISGMQHVDAIERGQPPADPTRIVQASLASQNRPVPAIAPAAPQEITADMLNAPLTGDAAATEDDEMAADE